MASLGKLRCGAMTDLEKLYFDIDVNVSKEGLFSTTLKPEIAQNLARYGLEMKTNRAGRVGYFCSDTLEGLRNAVSSFVSDCLSVEVVECKEVIRYEIGTTVHYVYSDEEDGFAIYPNGTWLPERLKKETSCSRWNKDTDDSPWHSEYKLSMYCEVFKKITYAYRSGKTVVKYEKSFQKSNDRSNVNYLRSLVRMNCKTMNIQEIDATEENAAVFVQMHQLMCKACNLFHQLKTPEQLTQFIRNNSQLSLAIQNETTKTK